MQAVAASLQRKFARVADQNFFTCRPVSASHAVRCRKLRSVAVGCGQMPSDTVRCRQMPTDAVRCRQMRADAARCREMPRVWQAVLLYIVYNNIIKYGPTVHHDSQEPHAGTAV